MDVSERRTREWFLHDERDSVRGYLQRTQAQALNALLIEQRRAGITGSLAEIGVFLGKTLIGLARAARPDEAVLGVDPLRIGGQDLTPELVANLKAHLTPEELMRVTLRRLLSTQLDAGEWMRSLKAPARFVHLDGHHARETMLHDLQLAAASLQPGALVVIDDFLNELHPDLTSGIIDGLAAHPQLEPVAVIPRMGHIEEGGSKLVCATRSHAEIYREALDRALSDHLRPWTDRMLGREVRVYRSSPPAKPAVAARSKPSDRPLPVVFALEDRDGAYWLNTAVAITSVAQYASRPIAIHVLHDEALHEVAKRRLAEVAREAGVTLSLMPVRLPETVDVKRLRQFGQASLFRLMIPKIFADEPLVIYLDSDLVSNRLDITSLASEVHEDAPIAGVRDPFIAAVENHADELRRLDLAASEYVNSGVLALRPALIREDLLERFAAFSDEHPNAIHPDQNFLNRHFQGRLQLLDERYNFQVALYGQRFLQPLTEYSGKIIHYAGKLKPLDGNMAPGLVPFFVHAYRVPEVYAGELFQPKGYLLPVKGDPNALTAQHLQFKPARAKKESAG